MCVKVSDTVLPPIQWWVELCAIISSPAEDDTFFNFLYIRIALFIRNRDTRRDTIRHRESTTKTNSIKITCRLQQGFWRNRSYCPWCYPWSSRICHKIWYDVVRRGWNKINSFWDGGMISDTRSLAQRETCARNVQIWCYHPWLVCVFISFGTHMEPLGMMIKYSSLLLDMALWSTHLAIYLMLLMFDFLSIFQQWSWSSAALIYQEQERRNPQSH